MEVERNIPPRNKFLNEVRKLCTKYGVILIFDECTTGFRKFNKGLHHHYKVVPDILLYGKAMGNGYAINAIIGKKEVMKFAKFSFISSTFWSERVGPTAALSTIKVMNQTNSFNKITKISNKISKEILKIANDNDIDLLLDNTPTSINFRLDTKDWMSYKIYLTQEMLRNKILAGPSIFVCIDHKDIVMQKYYENLNKIFKTFGDYINSKKYRKVTRFRCMSVWFCEIKLMFVGIIGCGSIGKRHINNLLILKKLSIKNIYLRSKYKKYKSILFKPTYYYMQKKLNYILIQMQLLFLRQIIYILNMV